MTPTPPELIGMVLDCWNGGEEFGVLVTGDAHHAETVFRLLQPTADSAFGHAEAVDAERLAERPEAIRVLALAGSVDSVDATLLRRCAVVITCASPRAPDTPPALESSRRSVEARDVRILRMLSAAGIHDHAIDLAAVRLGESLARAGATDPVAGVRALVVDPRRQGAVSVADDVESGGGSDPDTTSDPDAMREDGDNGEAGAPAPASASEAGDDADAEQEDVDAGEGDAGKGDAGGGDAGEGIADSAGEETTAAAKDEGAVRDDPVDADPPGPSQAPSVPGAGVAADKGTESDDVPTEEEGIPLTQEWIDVAEASSLSPGGADTAAVILARHFTDAVPLTPRTRPQQHLRGRGGVRSRSVRQGRVIRAVPLERAEGRIAIVPTLRQAAIRRSRDPSVVGGPLSAVAREDLRGVLRARRGGAHTVIVVDGSSSLGATGIARAGSVVDALLASIAARRGVLSVIVAAGSRARLVVERSTSLARARSAVAVAETGGGTPLADAATVAEDLLSSDPRERRRVIFLTDGRPTVGLDGRAASASAARAELIACLTGLAAEVADALLVPVGVPAGIRFAHDTAPFANAGFRIITS